MLQKRMCCIAIAIAASATLSGCEQKPSTKVERPDLAAGAGAAMAASAWVSAVRACALVGIGSVPVCTDLNGTLPAEISAQANAMVAVSSTTVFHKDCNKAFTAQYCD